ncbi:MAG TPA: isoleucine--tRNA ligase [Chitinophagales bacterium]|nr:isoleucine--tRNA ligase [Chitinophagales bacterium]HMW11752.1 isoleucine--tRNA ligase [Chitinophagales bacterium]HMX60534.1 isoleucine--tRNA ligase [Chitinophagales bacterium]HMY23616.1 isoleucine--tRNA ligase [Chitinophagales bacterium]HMZ32732.1 isoleucine--tRNA ligase [Chitinophagales bacterium]
MSNTKQYREIKNSTQTQIEQEISLFWQSNSIFEKSIAEREGKKPYVFYEGPPSANGMPGIHHVLARTIKDIFCRYKTIQGYQVKRKGGWDTHGLPVELQVEKLLGITKKDIGTKISVAEYNQKCREEVMKFKDVWDNITQKMGYWVDLNNPYITFDNNYIESIWWILKELYHKDLLYKGYKIQPYSPAAGTGLSSAELNLPGCYKDVKDTSAVAQFKISKQSILDSDFLPNKNEDYYFLAWTTTPWTLPSNTALAVGANIEYVLIKTINPYTHTSVQLILAKDLLHKYFQAENENKDFATYQNDGKQLPYQHLATFLGSDLKGIRYEQLLPFEANKKDQIDGDAFRVITGDFVTTSDGTGIVHIAPSFGADDMKVAAENGIGALTLVDMEGKFIDGVGEFSGRYVKDYKNEENYVSVDIDIAIKLKKENKAFKVEKYEHSYPHCWRTDKPIIYYPLDSWFVRVTAVKDRMVALNKTINWKPESTGSGRFGQWLENLIDWNLSRSRYWGTPLPIWRTEDKTEEICIGSIAELKAEMQKAIDAGFMDNSILDKTIDLHKPYVDDIILISASGKAMKRESDLIDVWFDSGAMPYAQWHFPFENKDTFAQSFPADFIAEGVDQTRGWFYTLHAIATMLFDNVAYKNVVSNGLVLDKNGNKMSKSKGNTVDPFKTIEKYGADVTRWYMISNSQPWDNLKFDEEGLAETGRKLFGTLNNTYNFFAIYANIDGFTIDKNNTTPLADRAEIDRWVISKLNSLTAEVATAYEEYEPTKATRLIEDFVIEHLSNWYVRLCRRRFWGNELSQDKKAAFETLHECLRTIAQLMSPVAPFVSDWLWQNLLATNDSVHLSLLQQADDTVIDKALEQRMEWAQEISSLVLSLRKKTKIKVRQPLQKILVPAIDKSFIEQIDKVKQLILSEVNVKEIEYISDTTGIISKKIKPNFKSLGKKLGSHMKAVAEKIQELDNTAIAAFEKNASIDINSNGETFTILISEVEIISDDIQGWLVASNNGITVALDTHISEDLKNEGFAREIVNKIQTERKESNFEVTDKIILHVQNQLVLNGILNSYKEYICNETLASDILFSDNVSNAKEFDINGEILQLFIQKK